MVQQCNATIIRRNILGNMPVFSNPAEYPGEYDPLTVSYYTEVVVPSLWPSIVGVAVFGVMLLGFILWRCWRLCGCRTRRKNHAMGPLPFDVNKEGGCVPRVKEYAEKKQVSMIASSSSLVTHHGSGIRSGKNILMGCVFVMMCGVVGSCIYGIVSTEHNVVSNAVDVIETSGRGYIQSVLEDVRETIDSGARLDAMLSSIQTLSQGSIDPGLAGQVTTVLSSIQQQLRDILQTAQDGVDRVENDVVVRIDEFIEEYEPQIQQYNTYRSAVMYVLYSLCMVLAMCVFVNAIVTWPFLHSLSIFLLLCLMVINFAAVVAYTAGIKVGSDTCQNIEPFIIDQVDDPAASSVLRYYFNGEGTVYDVVQQAANLDIQDIQQTIRDTKQSVESLTQGVALTPELQGQVSMALQQADVMLESIDSAVGKIEAEAVMTGPYVQVRGFLCCDTLDTVGDIWLSMILMGSFTFVMLLIAFCIVHRFDGLPLKRWYRRYTPPRRTFI